jgi:hypothetical protein
MLPDGRGAAADSEHQGKQQALKWFYRWEKIMC